MPPIDKQIEEINKSVAGINEATGAQNLTPISTETLQDQPDFKVPDTKEPQGLATAESFVKGTGDSLMAGLQAEQEAARKAAEGSYVDSLNQYTQALASQTGLQGFLAQEEKKAGVQPLQVEIAELQGQINTERLARAEMKTRLEQKGGGLKIGANAEYQNFARDSLFRETNAVIQLGVQSGRLNAAKQAAERLASAYYEQEQNALAARKEFVDVNKELFTTAERREFDLNYEAASRELDRQEQDLKTLQTTKTDAMRMAQVNEAPADVLQAIANAETPEEVIRVGGQYAAGDMLDRMYKRAQIASIQDTISRRSDAARKAAEEAATKEEAAKEQRKADTEQALGLRELAQNLLVDDGLDAAVGFGFGKTILRQDEAVRGTARADFEATAKRLANMLTLDNLDLMSGVLSETDIKILESAGSNLGNFDQSEKQYREEIQRVLDVAQRTITENGLTEEQAAFWGVLEGDEMAELNNIFD